MGYRFVYPTIPPMTATTQKAVNKMFNRPRNKAKPIIVGCEDCKKMGTACYDHRNLPPEAFLEAIKQGKAVTPTPKILQSTEKLKRALNPRHNTRNQEKNDPRYSNKGIKKEGTHTGQFVQTSEGHLKYIERTLGTRECGCPRYDKLRDQIVSCCACYQSYDRADIDNTHKDIEKGNCPGIPYCDLCNTSKESNIQPDESASNVSSRHSTIIPDNNEDDTLKAVTAKPQTESESDREIVDKMSVVEEWLKEKPIEQGMFAVECGRWRIPQTLRIIVRDRSDLSPGEINEKVTEYVTYEITNIAELSLDKDEITKACHRGEKMLNNDRPIPKAYIKDTPDIKVITRHLKSESCLIFSSKPKEVVDRESQTIIVKARKPFSKEME